MTKWKITFTGTCPCLWGEGDCGYEDMKCPGLGKKGCPAVKLKSGKDKK